MTLAMADSIYIANLPPAFPCYGAYVDGSWPTYAGAKARFPAAEVLSIAVFASSDADCCDRENGDLAAAQVPGWVKRQLARGVARPGVYASVANMPPILSALTAAGISRAQVRLWAAHYGLGPHICGPLTCKYFPGMPAMDGTQWTSTYRGAHGSLIDASLLLDNFFGGSPMSATGPENWDAKDWAALDANGSNALRWLTRAITGTVAPSMSTQQASDIGDAHAALTALIPAVTAIAAAVVTALPPAATGGLTEAQVEAAVQAGVAAAFAKAFPPPAA